MISIFTQICRINPKNMENIKVICKKHGILNGSDYFIDKYEDISSMSNSSSIAKNSKFNVNIYCLFCLRDLVKENKLSPITVDRV